MGKKTLDGTPLAGLFLILFLVILVLSGQPQGIFVRLAQTCNDDGDARLVVLKLLPNHGLTLMPEEQLRFGQLASRLEEIFKHQSERVLFVEADPDLPFQEIVDAIEISQKHVDHVAILTPSVANDPAISICIPSDPPEVTPFFLDQGGLRSMVAMAMTAPFARPSAEFFLYFAIVLTARAFVDYHFRCVG